MDGVLGEILTDYYIAIIKSEDYSSHVLKLTRMTKSMGTANAQMAPDLGLSAEIQQLKHEEEIKFTMHNAITTASLLLCSILVMDNPNTDSHNEDGRH